MGIGVVWTICPPALPLPFPPLPSPLLPAPSCLGCQLQQCNSCVETWMANGVRLYLEDGLLELLEFLFHKFMQLLVHQHAHNASLLQTDSCRRRNTNDGSMLRMILKTAGHTVRSPKKNYSMPCIGRKTPAPSPF